jgi:hypothetical protein
MRIASLLLLALLLSLAGCESFDSYRNRPSADYKPNTPTREMMF